MKERYGLVFLNKNLFSKMVWSQRYHQNSILSAGGIDGFKLKVLIKNVQLNPLTLVKGATGIAIYSLIPI